jgi:hypothetical protein
VAEERLRSAGSRPAPRTAFPRGGFSTVSRWCSREDRTPTFRCAEGPPPQAPRAQNWPLTSPDTPSASHGSRPLPGAVCLHVHRPWLQPQASPQVSRRLPDTSATLSQPKSSATIVSVRDADGAGASHLGNSCRAIGCLGTEHARNHGPVILARFLALGDQPRCSPSLGRGPSERRGGGSPQPLPGGKPPRRRLPRRLDPIQPNSAV